jgi:hypothetical protein
MIEILSFFVVVVLSFGTQDLFLQNPLKFLWNGFLPQMLAERK